MVGDPRIPLKSSLDSVRSEIAPSLSVPETPASLLSGNERRDHPHGEHVIDVLQEAVVDLEKQRLERASVTRKP